jgi:predicted esterase
MRSKNLSLFALAQAMGLLVMACDGDIGATSTGGAGGSTSADVSVGVTTAQGSTTGASSSTESSGSTTTGTGGAATTSTGAGGQGGSGGAGGAGGYPWEGGIDPDGGPPSDRLTPHPLGSGTAPNGFYEYVPAGYPAGKKWPLLLFLHGIGENGNGTTDLDDLFTTGLPQLIKNDDWPNDRPFVVLMSQHTGDACPSPANVHAMIAWGKENYEIDERYVYLTGLSCGAMATWSYLNTYLDDQVAAAVPICGNGAPAWNNNGCDLGRVALWAFHGEDDQTVPVSGTNVPMDGLAGCPHPPALESKKTIYPGVGHNSWDMTYSGSAGHDVFTWMLGFTKEP